MNLGPNGTFESLWDTLLFGTASFGLTTRLVTVASMLLSDCVAITNDTCCVSLLAEICVPEPLSTTVGCWNRARQQR